MKVKGALKKLLIAGSAVISVTAFAQDPVVVSSKIDTEGSVLGQVIYHALNDAGIPVTNRIQLGGTSIVRNALINGEIDIYPEYTGNGAFFFEHDDASVWQNAEKSYELIKQLDQDKNQLVWLTPADANNTWAISVRGDLARNENLNSLEDLANYLNADGEFKFAASAEFVDSPSALPAFQDAYGFTLESDQLLILSGGNTAATMRAAAMQTSGVNAAMTYGTDGGLPALDLIVLEDTLEVQPVYQPAPVIRQSTLNEYPQIADLLEPIFAELNLETLQRLNGDVAVNGEDAEVVARRFLDTISQ